MNDACRIEFEQEQVENAEERLAKLDSVIESETANLEKLAQDRKAIEDEIESLKEELKTQKAELANLEVAHNEKTTETEKLKKASSKSSSSVTKALQEIGTWVRELLPLSFMLVC